MAIGSKTGGRKAGTPNKTTASVRAAIVEAFDGLGGVKSLIEWGKENRTEFYTRIWVKLAPSQITGEDGGPIRFSQEELSKLTNEELLALYAYSQRDDSKGVDGEVPVEGGD